METSVPPPKGPQKTTAASLHTPCGIGDLPPEVLVIIFQFFNVIQLDSTISSVCHLWHNLSQRPSVRLKLALEFRGPDTATAYELLRSCPNLKDLSISGRTDANDLLRHVALYNHDLRRLAVNRCDRSFKRRTLSVDGLYVILLRCPNIVDLTIDNSSIWSNMFFHDLGVRLPNLRRIVFKNIKLFGPDELRMIVTRCRKLEEIRLVNLFLRLYDKDILLVAESLCGTLKVLDIDGEELSDEGLAALGQCFQLRELKLHFAFKMTDNGVFHLSRLQNLESLVLNLALNVSSSGWVQLFSQSRWRQLKELTLVNSGTVNDETLQQVASACPYLVMLNLSDCNDFTDEGLRCVLQKCTNLKYLEVRTRQKYVFRSFSFIPLHTRKLKRLVYIARGLEEENRVFMYLKETIPELQIIRL